jgi:hypothetical protein
VINASAAANRPVAAIDTDLFNWEIVPGESNKELVFRNLVMLAKNYLRYDYSVIISGLIITSEEAGALQNLRRFVIDHNIVFRDCYCSASRELVAYRNRTRDKDVPEEAVLRWWELAEQDRSNVAWRLFSLDMSLDLSQLTQHVLSTIKTTQC